MWRAQTRYRIAEGGRGSGKSYGIAERFVTYAIARPCRLLCTRETQSSLTDSSLAIIKRVISDYNLWGCFIEYKHGLACVNGSEFIFRGLQLPRLIRSLEGIQYCWVEEATKVTRDAWELLTPTIRAPGSEIWVSYNPDRRDDPTHKIFSDRPDVTRVKINYWDNPFFPEELRREMEWDKAHDHDKYLHVWEGQCREITAAQVFRGKYAVRAFDTPDDVDYYYGVDWGFAHDPSAMVRAFVKDGKLWVDHEAYGVGVEISEMAAFFRSVPESGKWPIIADSARPDMVSHMVSQGYHVQSARKGPGSVEDGIAFLRGFAEIVIHERCKHTAAEFAHYSYKTDRLTGEVLPMLRDEHNHIIDALRYAVERLHGAMPRIRGL